MKHGDIDSQGTITPLPADFAISGQTQGDVLYFDGANWVRLAPGVSGQRLETNGAAANPSWETDPAIPLPTDLNISGQATGDIIYFNGANWVRLPAGTSTYLLQANGAAAPTWVAPSGGGNLVITGGFRETMSNTDGNWYSSLNGAGMAKQSDMAGSVRGGIVAWPQAGTFKNLRAEATVGWANTFSMSLRKNESGTSLGISMAGGSRTGTDLVDTVSVAVGDRMNFILYHNSTATDNIVAWTMEFEPS
jgi:hypothetical protein